MATTDLQAIRSLISFANNDRNDRNDSDVAKITAELAQGELLWSQSTESLESSNDRKTNIIQWDIEPNGYQRLRLATTVAQENDLGNTLTMTRRFSPAAIPGPPVLHWFLGSASLFVCVLVGFLVALRANRRRHFLSYLQEWSKHVTDGRELRKDVSVNSLTGMDQAAASLLAQAADGMHQRLESNQKSVEQSSRVMSAMPVGVLALDRAQKLLFVNRAGRELLGLEADCDFGQPMLEILRNPTIVDLILRVSSESASHELELELPQGKITLRLRAHPLPDLLDESRLSSRSGTLITITDETRLKKLENARRDFTANVSHELKTPLSAIKAYAETLLMGAIDDDQARNRFVERIAEQANRLDALIRDLLHLTKLQSQPDRPILSSLSLDDVLKTCVEEHRTIGQSKKIEIDTSGVEPNRLVLAELESLRTIIGNLLSNAVRYNRPEGWIKVSTRTLSDSLVLIIADSGIGIPPEDLDRIFERFYRVEKARSQDAGGTGLGLSIVKHLVQAMDGDIRVRSTLGEGTVFEITLRQPATTEAVRRGPTKS